VHRFLVIVNTTVINLIYWSL